MRRRLPINFLPVLGLALLIGSQALASESRTVLDGVYTAAQAEQGKAVYASSCASCHGSNLIGFSGPPLKGDLFFERWREFNLNVIHDLIQKTMPADNAGGLSQDNYLSVLAFILQANDVPAGKEKLGASSLATTLLVGPEGPRPLSSSSQVVVVGCMTEDSGNGFFLTSAAEPARTLDIFSLTPEELKAARNKPLGGLVFRLENLADLSGISIDKTLGQKMDAKGVLVRQPKGDRINVTALDATGAPCEH